MHCDIYLWAIMLCSARRGHPRQRECRRELPMCGWECGKKSVPASCSCRHGRWKFLVLKSCALNFSMCSCAQAFQSTKRLLKPLAGGEFVVKLKAVIAWTWIVYITCAKWDVELCQTMSRSSNEVPCLWLNMRSSRARLKKGHAPTQTIMANVLLMELALLHGISAKRS